MDCQLFFTYEVNDCEFASRETENPDSSPFQLSDINFNFSYKIEVSEWVMTQDSTEPRFLRRVQQPVSDHLFSMSHQQFFRFAETRKLMEEELSCLPGSSDSRRGLVDYALDEALKRLETNVTSHDEILNIQFDLFLEHRHVLSVESCPMIPAADSAIQALKTVDYCRRSMETSCCSICLEDFSGGECEDAFMVMPCSHIFHGNCIKKWLRTSHNCPLCRFSMPIS